MVELAGNDVLTVDLDKHIARLICVNLERKQIPVRVANTLNECFSFMQQRLPDTIIVPNDDVAAMVKSAIKDPVPQVIVIDELSLL
jgi:DNA-binding response OmpR family regulator